MYEVSLNNKSCLFDSATFDTAREAISWASGRGGTYTVNIVCPNWPGGYSYSETDTAKRQWREKYYWETHQWIRISIDQILEDLG